MAKLIVTQFPLASFTISSSWIVRLCLLYLRALLLVKQIIHWIGNFCARAIVRLSRIPFRTSRFTCSQIYRSNFACRLPWFVLFAIISHVTAKYTFLYNNAPSNYYQLRSSGSSTISHVHRMRKKEKMVERSHSMLLNHSNVRISYITSPFRNVTFTTMMRVTLILMEKVISFVERKRVSADKINITDRSSISTL